MARGEGAGWPPPGPPPGPFPSNASPRPHRPQVALAIAGTDLLGNISVLPFVTGHMSKPWYWWVMWPVSNSGTCLGWKVSPTDMERLRRIEAQGLISAELCEFIIPLAYGWIYIICRGGPNGKVRVLWQGQGIA